MTALLKHPAWDQVPDSLDGIIRRNRDLARLRQPTKAEIAGLRGAVKRRRPLLILSPWWLAALDLALDDGRRHVVLMLVGATKRGEGWASSGIQALDEEAGFVRTRHRLYRVLGPRSAGDPGERERLALCAFFHVWGAGDTLGVPKWFNWSEGRA